MFSMKSFALILFFVSFSLLHADKIEVSSNGTIAAENLTAILAEKKIDMPVVECDFNHYPGLKKNRSRLGKILKKLGWERKAIPVKEDVRKIIFMNIPPTANRDLNLIKLPKEKMVLFMWEPPLRIRKMYSKKIQDCFSRIYTWDDDLVDNKTYFKFYYPVLLPMIDQVVPFEEKKLCTMVVGNTCDMTRYPEELYSERIKAARFFESIPECNFEFYGKNWDPAEYKSYKGTVDDKIAVISNYRFIICYENTRGLNGYVTEKIFDCFAAGTVPIYWGASNIEEYVPKECFIDRREFESLDQLYSFMRNMSAERYEEYLQHIRSYLTSEKAQLFSYDHFKDVFLTAVGE